jgi:hypothetical protein
MPIYLFGLVAALREKPAKGYPVKKVTSPFKKRAERRRPY